MAKEIRFLGSKLSQVEAGFLLIKAYAVDADLEASLEARKELDKLKVFFSETPNWPEELRTWIRLNR